MKLVSVSLLTAAALLSLGNAQASEALAKEKNCFACHTIDKKSLAPAYKDVAQKYAKQKDIEARLAAIIVNGTLPPNGAGWQKEGKATLPFMPPNSAVKPDEAAKLAKWIMGLK